MDVIVIGCGASGIAALTRLQQAGLKVMGLEAANRIGGRIHTVPFGENVVDLGAAWCHGNTENVIFELAKPYNLLAEPEPDTKWFVLSNGEVLPNDKGEEILNAINQEIGKADKSGSTSISECVRNALKANKSLQRDPKLAESFVEWFERNCHVGGQDNPREGKSLRSMVEFRDGDGALLDWKGRGFKTVLDLLLNKYPDPSKEIPVEIMFNKEVENITWGSSLTGFSNPLVQVKCKDGSLYGAKSVIVTVSLGVLKERHAQLFKPPLPVEKANTINNLQFCVLGKIYIEFTKPWWPKSPANFLILWRDDDKAKFSEDEKWITEIYGLISIAAQPNVLLAWTYGNGAKMMEKVGLAEVEAGVKKLFDTMFQKFEVTPIKNIVRTQWASNPFTGGAYAYRSVALEEDGGSAAVLSEPLYHGDSFPVVCFGGEATSHTRHSAVHGAIEAGFREADRLIDSFKKLQH